ncbi:hypothetical protein ACM66B_004387 [Microbotryomycetes sp. NB124-2]
MSALDHCRLLRVQQTDHLAMLQAVKAVIKLFLEPYDHSVTEGLHQVRLLPYAHPAETILRTASAHALIAPQSSDILALPGDQQMSQA